MQLYRERLWPSAWIFIMTALVIPASLLVFLPINAIVGVITAVLLYAGAVTILTVTAPVIEVTTGSVAAGRAHLPLNFAGAPSAFTGPDAVLERGQRLDARAWVVIRGWVSPVVKVPVTDPGDPAPYWLVSSRHPTELVAAIEDAREKARVTP